nr:hypothetical protein [Micromonospora sp.]
MARCFRLLGGIGRTPPTVTVTLPGAFVGVLLGVGTPVEAVAVAVTIELVADGLLRRPERRG